jgi:hypothetical protein
MNGSETEPDDLVAAPSYNHHWFQFPSFGRKTTKRSTTTAAPTPPFRQWEDPTVMISKGLNDLSFQEREKAYEDLHGVAEVIHETPELIANALKEMEHELQVLPNASKRAYELAKSKNMVYVQDSKLRLMFLRADRFAATKAAARFVEWFQWKLELFGRNKLCQEQIRLEDLDDDGRAMVESGRTQILPCRDSRGRAVVLGATSHNKRLFKSAKGALQMIWYCNFSVVEDEVTQRQGAVLILCALWSEQDGLPPSTSSSSSLHEELKEFIWRAPKLSTSIPIRWEGVHVLTAHSGHFQSVAHSLLNAASRFMLARFRIHSGSACECEYGLMTFGLPSSLLPYTSDGVLKTGNHKKWLQRRLVKEQEEKLHSQQKPQPQRGGQVCVFSGIDVPSMTDILLGKGKPIQAHRGNQVFQKIMKHYEEEYNLAKRNGGKTIVAQKIIGQVKNTHHTLLSGRFLRRRKEDTTSGWWEEVTDEEALIERIRNGFRNMRAGHKVATTTTGSSLSSSGAGHKTIARRTTTTAVDYSMDYRNDNNSSSNSQCCWMQLGSESSSSSSSVSSYRSNGTFTPFLDPGSSRSRMDEEITNPTKKFRAHVGNTNS